MTRRDALGSLAALLLPTWKLQESVKPPVPLHEFCNPFGDGWRYNVSAPFLQANQDERLFAYSTDCKIAIRVDARDDLKGNDDVRRPPACKLDWDYDSLSGWKPWPKADHLVRKESKCLKCRGYGTADGKPAPNCPKCDGDGCRKCKYAGDDVAFRVCSVCGGDGYGTFPALQAVGGEFVAVEYDLKIRTHLRDVEYVVKPFTRKNWDRSQDKQMTAIAFRFDGGRGLVMPMNVT